MLSPISTLTSHINNGDGRFHNSSLRYTMDNHIKNASRNCIQWILYSWKSLITEVWGFSSAITVSILYLYWQLYRKLEIADKLDHLSFQQPQLLVRSSYPHNYYSVFKKVLVIFILKSSLVTNNFSFLTFLSQCIN